MSKRRAIISIAGALAIVLIGTGWLYAQQRPSSRDISAQVHQAGLDASTTPAQHRTATTTTPTIGTPVATPNLITVNTPTVVTVTAQITDPSLIPGSVNLLRLGPTGTPPTIVGVMHNDGRNGDALAGDSIYTLQVQFNESTAGQIQLQVSVAFQSLLKRVVSSTAGVDIWNSLRVSNTQGSFSTIYPANWTSESLQNLGSSTEASPGVYVSSLDDDIDDNGVTLEILPDTISSIIADLNARYTPLSDTSQTVDGLQWRVLRHQESDSGLIFITALAQGPGLVYSLGAKDIASNAAILQTMIQHFKS